MLKNIKNEAGDMVRYCEIEDLIRAGMSQGYLKKAMNYYRAGKSVNYANIADPSYHGRGSKRLVRIDSISDAKVRGKVEELLNIASEAVKEALQITSEQQPDKLMNTASKAVGNIIEMSLPLIHAEMRKLTADAQDIEYYRAEGANLILATQFALSYKVLKWIKMQWQAVENARNVDKTAFCAIMAEAILNPPPMELKFTDKIGGLIWLVEQIIKPKTDLRAIVKTGKLGNENAKKIDKALEDWVIAQYSQGNKPKISHLHRAYKVECKKRNWTEVSYSTLYNICKSYQQVAQVERSGVKEFRLQNKVTVQRELPAYQHAVWEIDGTPANMNVWDAKAGKARQYLYKAYVIDASCGRIVGVAYSKGETASLYIDALKDAIRYTSHIPQVVHCDHFAGHKIVADWLQSAGSRMHLVSVGNARNKMIERILGHFSDSIERYQPGFNGLNMTAKSDDSHVSNEFIQQNMPYTLTYEKAGEWMKTEGREWYNNQVMEQLNKKACGKTPNEMAAELPSATAELTNEIKLMLCGHEHIVKLTVDGLLVKYENEAYTYFPQVHGNDLDELAEWFNMNLRKRLKLYTYEHGDEALVVTMEGKRTAFGMWKVKDSVPYSPHLFGTGDGAKLAAMLGIGKKQEEQAKARVKEAKHNTNNMTEPAEDKTARYGYALGMDKVEFAKAEKNAKAGKPEIMKLKRIAGGFVDVETGEEIKINPISKLPLLPKDQQYEIVN